MGNFINCECAMERGKDNRVGKYIWNNVDMIGKGTYGKVYKGYKKDTNEQIAVKKIILNFVEQDGLED